MTADYRVVIVDKTGTRYNELPTATIQNVSWTLNDIGSASFNIDIGDTNALDLRLLTREIQIWRDNNIMWWGVPTRVRADSRQLSVQCQDLLWYFRRRFLGKPGRMNLLSNADFEDSVPPLPPVGWSTFGTLTATTDSSVAVLGTRSVHLDPSGSSGNNFLYQELTVPQSNATYYVSAEYYIPSFSQGATENRGIGAVVYEPPNGIISSQFMMVDESSPIGQWNPIQFSFYVPQVSNTCRIQILLYGCVPSINWDAVYLAMDEQINYTGADMSNIAIDLIDRAQVPPDYSDLNISTVASPGISGIHRTLTYKLTDHNNVFDIVSSLTKEQDKNLGTVDISMEITPTTRQFTIWPLKGTHHTTETLEWGKNLADYTYELDGERTSSSVIVQGDGFGPTRLERGYVDASSLSGLILQDIFQAPTNAPISTLDALAYQAFNRAKQIVEVIEVTTSDPALVPLLKTGDTILVKIQEGWVNIQGTYRIVKIDLNPSADQLHLTLNLPPS